MFNVDESSMKCYNTYQEKLNSNKENIAIRGVKEEYPKIWKTLQRFFDSDAYKECRYCFPSSESKTQSIW